MSKTQKEIDLSKVVEVILENKKPISLVTMVVTLISIVYCIFATPIFTAKVLINPPRLSDSGTSFSQVISGLGVLNSGGSGILNQKTDADIVMTILRTATVQNMVVKEFNLNKILKAENLEIARAKLSQMVLFIPDVKSGFLEIDVDSPDPKLATNIANYYTVALGQAINNVAYRRADQRYKFYQEQLKIAIISLHDAESALRTFTEKNGILAGQQIALNADISTQLQAQLISLQMQQQSIGYYVAEDNPDYQALQVKIDSIKKQLEQLSSQEIDSDVAIPVGLARQLASKYVGLMRDLKFREVVYEVIQKQSKASQLDAQSELAPLAIQVIDVAQIPIYKSKPKRLKVIVGSCFLSIVLMCVYFIIKNRKKIIIEAAS